MTENPETKNKATLGIFTWGIFISSLVLSPFVLDFTLNARFIFLSLTLLLVTWKIHEETPSKVYYSLPVLAYSIFIIWNLCGLTWALNVHEALADAAKSVLAWCVLVTAYVLYEKYSVSFLARLAQIAVGVSVVLFVVFAWQLFEAGSLSKESMYSVTGLNGHKNLFSSFLFLLICYLIYAFGSLSQIWKKLVVGSLVIDLLVILVLRTKAVYIGMICTALIYLIFLLISKRRFSITVFTVSGIILLLSANLFFVKVLPLAIDRSLSIAGKSDKASLLSLIDEERLQLWKKSYHIINEKPLAGTGPGNWQVWFPDATLSGIYRAEDLNFTFQRPHNDLLWILSETGYVGLNFWLIFIIGLILFALYRAQQNSCAHTKKLLFIVAAIVGFITMSFFDFPKERIEHLGWFSVLLAIACASTGEVRQKRTFQLSPATLSAILYLFSIGALLTGIFRYSGELLTRKMYGYKSEGVHFQVITYGNKAKNLVYTLDPTSLPISWYTGNAHASMGNYEMAKKEFEAAHRENPYNRNVLNDLGSALIFRGDTTSAITMYSEAARISPRYDEPRLNLSAIFIARKNYKEAARLLESIKHDSERRSRYQRILSMLIQQQPSQPR